MQLLSLCSVVGFLLPLSSALYGPEDRGGNGTFPLLKASDGTPVANAKLMLDLDGYENSGLANPYDNSTSGDSLIKREDEASLDWMSVLHYNYGYAVSNGTSSQQLQRRLDIHECTTWVSGAGACVNAVWDGLVAVWDIAYLIKQSATAKSCAEIHGQMGGLWYRYWAAGGDCGTTAEQKTIAGAIHEALKRMDGEWTCNVYCITMTHGGTWTGTLLIGPSESAMWANCGGVFHGCYDAGCGALEGYYNCNS